eukprot:gene5179-10358_t
MKHLECKLELSNADTTYTGVSMPPQDAHILPNGKPFDIRKKYIMRPLSVISYFPESQSIYQRDYRGLLKNWEDKLQLGKAQALKLSNQSFTVACWINVIRYNGLEVNSGDNAILGMDKIGSGQTLHILVRCKKLWFDFYNGGMASETEICENTWYHVAFVYDIDARTMSIYVNGELDNSTGEISPLQGNNMVFISSYAGGRGLNGRISNLHIWSVALPAQAIRATVVSSIPNSCLQPELQKLSNFEIIIDISAYKRKGHDPSLEASVALQYERLMKTNVTNGLSNELSVVLSSGRKKWGRSKIMIVGEGRAGKTAFSNTIIGKEYQDTQSTIGINEMTCEIKSINGTSKTWGEFTTPGKEYETALATLISKQRIAAVNTSSTNINDKSSTATIAEPFLGVTDKVTPMSEVKDKVSTESVAGAMYPDNNDNNDDFMIYDQQNDINHLEMKEQSPPLPSSADVDEDYVIKALSQMTLDESHLILSVYDFGGQSVFNVIHPFFLTRYGVYLIVFNMKWLLSNDFEKNECISYLSHWLNSVIVHTYHKDPTTGSALTAPFAFVGTHKDIINNAGNHEKISQILYDTFGSNIAWGSLLDNIGEDGVRGKTNMYFFPIDNTISRRDTTVLRLLQTIETAVNRESYVHEEKPLTWFRALDEISNSKKSSLTMTEVVDIAFSAGIGSTYMINEMLLFFHEVGILMWHSDATLRDTIILDPIKFFVTPATTVICKYVPTATDSTYHTLPIHAQCRKFFGTDFNLMIKKGIVTERLLLKLLEDSGDSKQQIVRLMLKYGLLVALDGSLEGNQLDAAINVFATGDHSSTSNSTAAVKDTSPKRFVVPALLPLSDVSIELSNPMTHSFLFAFRAHNFDGLDDLSASVVYGADLKSKGFLPNGIFQQLMSRAIAWSQETYGFTTNYEMYQDIAILYVGNQQFRMIERPRINCIQVDVAGGSPLAVHERLRFMLDKVVSECMKCLAISTLLPFTDNCLSHVVVDDTSIFVSLDAIRNITEKSSALTIGMGGHRSLLSSNEAKERYAVMISNAGQQLDYYDVFISYRWGPFDSDFVQKIFDRLTMYTVANDADRPIHTFLDTKRLQLGRPYQRDFALAMTRSSVIVPIVSYEALQRMVYHDDSKVDNVLVEWLSMQLCAERPDRCSVRFVMPILFGKRNSSSTLIIDNLFADPIIERLPNTIPTATIAIAVLLLRDIGVLTETEVIESSKWTVRNIVNGLMKFLLLNASDLCDGRGPGGILTTCVNRIYDTILSVPMHTLKQNTVENRATAVVIGKQSSVRSTVALSSNPSATLSHCYPPRLTDYTVLDVIALFQELAIPIESSDITRLKITGSKLVEVEQVSDFADLGLLMTGIHSRILLKDCKARAG